MPDTFFVTLPLVQVIVTFLGCGVGVACVVTSGAGAGAFSWVSITLMVGDEYVKPAAESVSQPFFSLMICVAT